MTRECLYKSAQGYAAHGIHGTFPLSLATETAETGIFISTQCRFDACLLYSFSNPQFLFHGFLRETHVHGDGQALFSHPVVQTLRHFFSRMYLSFPS